MRGKACIFGVAAAALLLATGPLGAAPEPAQALKSWQLDFEFQDLARLTLTLPGDHTPTTFWYLLYTVTNNSGEDVEFYPAFDLVTGSLEVITGGDNISPSVYAAIAARHKKMYPFFRDPVRASGKLLQGTDNARTSAAVFRDFTPRANVLTVYVAGLSGEVARVANPAFDAEKAEEGDNVPFFALRKSLAIRYDLPGDEQTRQTATPVRQGSEWVMR